MPTVTYGKSQIDFSIRRSSARNTLEVAVDPEVGVVVTCPSNLSETMIEKAVLKKAPWILRKISHIGQIVLKPPEREYVSGETYYYLGRGYRLKVIEDTSVHPYEVKLRNGRFQVRIPPISSEHPREILVPSALRWWFQKKAEKRLEERVEWYSSRIGVEPAGLVVKNQMKRWGTCSKDNIVYLNWRVIMAPLSIVDYVVVHELVHVQAKDHSNEFWNRVSRVLPDYERRKEWLRINGPTLEI